MARLETGESFFVVFLQAGAVAGAAEIQEARLVVAEEGDGAVPEGEVDDLVAVGAAVDEVADEDEAVVGGDREAIKQFGEFEVAAVDVSDGDDAACHAGRGELGWWRKC